MTTTTPPILFHQGHSHMTTQHITIHTDGSCLGNPGPGGHAAVLRRYEGDKEIKQRTVKGRAVSTTNNRMELEAALAGLGKISRGETSPIIVYSDSKYVIEGMTNWLSKWKANDWRTAGGGQVKNREQWEALDAASDGLNVRWEWVKGHDGDPRNDEVDTIARAEAKRAKELAT